jgi:lycopene cyclase domain-containing protein
MKRLKYLFLELAWFLPVIIGQWLIGPGIVRSRWKAVPLVALPLAAYLTAKDRLALAHGTWSINPETSSGLKVAGVPLEEALFFLLTSWVSAQGTILLVDERSHAAAARIRRRPQLRRNRKDTAHP